MQEHFPNGYNCSLGPNQCKMANVNRTDLISLSLCDARHNRQFWQCRSLTSDKWVRKWSIANCFLVRDCRPARARALAYTHITRYIVGWELATKQCYKCLAHNASTQQYWMYELWNIASKMSFQFGEWLDHGTHHRTPLPPSPLFQTNLICTIQVLKLKAAIEVN